MTENQQTTSVEPATPRTWLKRLAPAGILVAALLVVLAVAAMPKAKRDVPAAKAPPVNVHVQVLAPIAAVADVSIMPGVAEPLRVVNVAAEVPGRIESVHVQEGQTVQAGQPIISLNSDLLRAEYDRAAAQAEFDQREYERTAELSRRNLATANELDIARTKAAASRAALASAKATLDRSTIYARSAGVLNKLPHEVGEYVTPGLIVAEVVEIDTAIVAVEAPERDVQYLQLGQEHSIELNRKGLPPQIQGKISYISEIADNQTRTTRVELLVDNRPLNGAVRPLHAGQIVNVRLTLQTLAQAIMVPLEAIIPLESGHAVYVVEDGTARQRSVTLGVMRGRLVQVTEGLAAGENLIVSGQRQVSTGQAVKIVSEQAAGEVPPATLPGAPVQTKPVPADAIEFQQ